MANPVVVFDGSTIVSVEQGGIPPAGAVLNEFPGATLLPGLVDAHMHLAFDASLDPIGRLAGRDDASALAAMRTAARTAVLGGVTTVRDLGDRGFLSLALRGEPGRPTIVAAGTPITTIGGHCHFLGGGTDPDPDAVRRAVREHTERGVDVIKIMASGGELTPGSRPELSQFDRPALEAVVDEAHRHGLPITAHVHGRQSIADAAAAGVDGLEHHFLVGDRNRRAG